jgi:hypothetical protein
MTRALIIFGIWLLVGLMSAVILDAAKAHASARIEHCAAQIASLTEPSLIARQTAIRRAREICKHMELHDPYLFRSLKR